MDVLLLPPQIMIGHLGVEVTEQSQMEYQIMSGWLYRSVR